MATVLVQTGTLRVGDVIVAGETWGRVKAMFDEWGHRRKTVGPATPAKVMGLATVPQGGDLFTVLEDDRVAREIVEERQREREAAALRPTQVVTLETFYGEVQAGKTRELNIVLKTDVQGTLDAARNSLERLSEDTVKVNIIHAATGTVIESDVMLALASKGIVVGFNTRPEPGVSRLAEAEGVDIRYYEIIYELVDDVTKAVKGLLEPVYVEVVEGHAEVRQVFRVRTGRVAGCYVRDGQITRGASARVVRGEEVLHTSRVGSLKRFQEDVREVQAGYECGIGVEGFTDYQEGDVIETFGRQRKS